MIASARSSLSFIPAFHVMDFAASFPDLEPIPQNEGKETPVCSIAYSPEFIEAHDYLRALLRIDERSQRALDLTTICLKLNPANYTVWHYRRRILVELSGGGNIDDESITKDLDFAEDLGGTNPKNYQLWYHRRALLEVRFRDASSSIGLEAAKKELCYVDRILEDDSKNYHAWSHRQWIIRTIDSPELWKLEIDYSHSKVREDPRNNSAWSQRWFATHQGQCVCSVGKISGRDDMRDKRGILSLDMAAEEAHYAICGAELDPYNESPWRYLIGVITEQWRYIQKEGSTNDTSDVNGLISNSIAQIRNMKQSFEEKLSSDENEHVPCVSLISALIDLLELSSGSEALEEACALCRELTRVDLVRRKYWHQRGMEAAAKLKK